MAIKTTNQDPIARAIWATLESANECDSNLEPANVVDGLFAIARSISKLADAVQEANEKSTTYLPNLPFTQNGG